MKLSELNVMILILKELYKNKKNYNNDLGIDLYCPEDVILLKLAKLKKLILRLNVSHMKHLKINGYMLVPRSSISKTPLRMSNSIGIIDPSYRGEIMAVAVIV